jgi:polysaccharide pyruvyl transferase WcaK-like protein
MGVKGHIELCPDLAFSLPTPSAELERGTVGVGVMAFYGTSEERDQAQSLYDRYLEQLLSLVQWLVDRGRTIRLFTGDQVDEQVIDAVFAHLRTSRPDLPAQQVRYEPVRSLDALMEQLAAAEIVIATRYHNVLCALKCSRPTIALGYGVKHRDLMAQFGMTAFYQDVRGLDQEVLREQIVQLEADPDRWERLLAERNRTMQADAAELFTFIDDVLAPTLPGRDRRLAARTGQA